MNDFNEHFSQNSTHAKKSNNFLFFFKIVLDLEYISIISI